MLLHSSSFHLGQLCPQGGICDILRPSFKNILLMYLREGTQTGGGAQGDGKEAPC